MSLSIDGTTITSAHFVGILGSGMSALAQYLRWSGVEVSGSDRLLGRMETGRDEGLLRETGCRLFAQDGSGISAATSAVVVSTAIESDNPDIREARGRGLRLVHRSELLSAIVSTRTTIAVAGTSGKSTVTAMIFELLTECARDPSLITGAGILRLTERGFIGNAWAGRSDLLVIEADESDGSLVRYHPHISVFLNVSTDHKPVHETMALFEKLAQQSRFVIVNADDGRLSSLRANRTFGVARGAQFAPDEVAYAAAGTRIVRHGIAYDVPLPGEHNAQNVMAALCVCDYLGCSGESLAAAVRDFHGIRRRFSFVSRGAVTVIDDYAHNPAKIAAAIGAARRLGGRVIALFQPHGFGPLRFMKDDLISALRASLGKDDVLLLLPVYYAGGTAQRDISSQSVAAELSGILSTVHAPQRREDALPLLRDLAKPGDCVLSMGARDPSLEMFARQIAAALDA